MHLHEMTLDNIGQWPLLIKGLVQLGLGIFILSLSYYWMLKNNLQTYARLKAEESSLKCTFEQSHKKAHQLKAIKNQFYSIKERFGTLLNKLPQKNEMPGLLDAISKAGIREGLSFLLFAPQKELIKGILVERPIKIIIKGSYFQLIRFLKTLATMTRIVTFHDFKLENTAPFQSEEVLLMTITASIYRYRI